MARWHYDLKGSCFWPSCRGKEHLQKIIILFNRVGLQTNTTKTKVITFFVPGKILTSLRS